MSSHRVMSRKSLKYLGVTTVKRLQLWVHSSNCSFSFIIWNNFIYSKICFFKNIIKLFKNNNFILFIMKKRDCFFLLKISKSSRRFNINKFLNFNNLTQNCTIYINLIYYFKNIDFNLCILSVIIGSIKCLNQTSTRLFVN